jgi:hypothetical protein
MLVVADNSPLRYLRVLDCAHVLPVLFGRILIPQAVMGNCSTPRRQPLCVPGLPTRQPGWKSTPSLDSQI